MAKKSNSPKNLIVIKVKSLGNNDADVTIEVENLTSEPFVRSIDKASKREYIVPLRAALALSGKSLMRESEELAEKLTIQRCKLYHPTKLARYVASEYDDKETSNVILRSVEEDPTDEDPVLIWKGNSLGESKENGWRLSIVGFENLPGRLPKPRFAPEPEDVKEFSLGFASWDDREAILGLVESMRDTDFLAVMAALTDPDSAAKRVALDAATEALKGYRKQITADAINDMIQGSNEIAIGHTQSTSIRIDEYSLDGNNVLLSIRPPGDPLFKEGGLPPELGFFARRSRNHKIRKHNQSLTPDQIKAEENARDKAEVSRWMDMFVALAKTKGWRQVRYHDDPIFNCVDLTLISEEDWIKIEPAFDEMDNKRDRRFDFSF
jgi:hypothetical protein